MVSKTVLIGCLWLIGIVSEITGLLIEAGFSSEENGNIHFDGAFLV